MISIQQMEYILALSEERQFQRASERCFVTQPTLSMQLKKAESVLGAPIFDRSRSPIELTPFGERLLPIIRDVLTSYEQIQVLTEKSDGTYIERIRVGVIPTIAGYLVARAFEDWKELLPTTQLTIRELKTEELLLAIEKREIDLGILAGPISDPKLRTTVLYEEEILAYTGRICDEEITTQELESMQPWLLTEGNCLRTQMVHFCQLEQEGEGWSYEGGNLTLLQEMVARQGGYTLVPLYSREEKEGYARIRSETNEHPARQVIALTANKSSKWPSMEKLIRDVQLRYGSKSKNEFQLLSWK